MSDDWDYWEARDAWISDYYIVKDPPIAYGYVFEGCLAYDGDDFSMGFTFEEEMARTETTKRQVPRWIAEAYGDGYICPEEIDWENDETIEWPRPPRTCTPENHVGAVLSAGHWQRDREAKTKSTNSFARLHPENCPRTWRESSKSTPRKEREEWSACRKPESGSAEGTAENERNQNRNAANPGQEAGTPLDKTRRNPGRRTPFPVPADRPRGFRHLMTFPHLQPQSAMFPREKSLGLLWGLVVGDCLGSPIQFTGKDDHPWITDRWLAAIKDRARIDDLFARFLARLRSAEKSISAEDLDGFSDELTQRLSPALP